jgi:hypothetical protein
MSRYRVIALILGIIGLLTLEYSCGIKWAALAASMGMISFVFFILMRIGKA